MIKIPKNFNGQMIISIMPATIMSTKGSHTGRTGGIPPQSGNQSRKENSGSVKYKHDETKAIEEKPKPKLDRRKFDPAKGPCCF